jgi:integrase/recombinase XerD
MGNKNRLPDMMNKEQLTKLFEAMDRPKCVLACFMAVMCGLRVREVCRLQIQDIDLQRRIIKIRDSKNPNRKKQNNYGKDRIVPIPQIAISPIKKWLSIIEGGKWFLPSAKSPDLHLRTKTLHRWFSEARRQSGLNHVDYVVKYKKEINHRNMSPVYKFRFHHLRHFYAQLVYEKTRDLYAVANLLGHNQVTTTQIYAKVSDKQMKETVDFAFDVPIRTQIFEKNPINALNYKIPEIAKREKAPAEVLEERFAKGEISAIDFQTALRLLKVRKDYLSEKETEKVKIIKED